MRGPCGCRHCATPAAEETPAAPEPVELPDRPTPIRVHQPGRPPFDCTLHPDGTLTAVFNGVVHRNGVDLAGMRETNWATARIEFDPPPLIEEPEPEFVPVQPEPVQDVIPLTA